jgi:hypothetical protein
MLKNEGFQIHSAVVVKINAVCDATPCDLNEDAIGRYKRTFAIGARTGHTFNPI